MHIEFALALKLAKALLEEADYNPSAIIGMDFENQVCTIWNHEENLAEALITFFAHVKNLEDIKDAISAFEKCPSETDLVHWNQLSK